MGPSSADSVHGAAPVVAVAVGGLMAPPPLGEAERGELYSPAPLLPLLPCAVSDGTPGGGGACLLPPP